ncbi:unnamed protein product [Caenorhabditis sp. 36 PRJEB53466]|nr:unnamed protein product [Caenorhabditis sp. 36 PRJEB53466]
MAAMHDQKLQKLKNEFRVLRVEEKIVESIYYGTCRNYEKSRQKIIALLEKNEAKIDEKTTKDLYAEFVQEGEYGVMKEWIYEKYVLNDKDLSRTKEVLNEDIVVRKNIKKAYADLKNAASSNQKRLIFEKIYGLIYARNIALESLQSYTRKDLWIDVHWFTTKHVAEYCAELLNAIENLKTGTDPHPLRKVKIIIGKGKHSETNDNFLKTAVKKFMSQNGIKFSMLPENNGVIVWDIYQKTL